MGMEIELARAALLAMKKHAERCGPAECCGILLGEGGRIDRALAAANIHAQPNTHFEIDPQALIDAHRETRNDGPQVLGYYHSHPSSRAEPSATDCEGAARDGRVWAILGTDGLRLWRDANSGFQPLAYRVLDG